MLSIINRSSLKGRRLYICPSCLTRSDPQNSQFKPERRRTLQNAFSTSRQCQLEQDEGANVKAEKERQQPADRKRAVRRRIDKALPDKPQKSIEPSQPVASPEATLDADGEVAQSSGPTIRRHLAADQQVPRRLRPIFRAMVLAKKASESSDSTVDLGFSPNGGTDLITETPVKEPNNLNEEKPVKVGGKSSKKSKKTPLKVWSPVQTTGNTTSEQKRPSEEVGKSKSSKTINSIADITAKRASYKGTFPRRKPSDARWINSSKKFKSSPNVIRRVAARNPATIIGNLMREIKANKHSVLALRTELVKVLQDDTISDEAKQPAIKMLRESIQPYQGVQPVLGGQSLEEALRNPPSAADFSDSAPSQFTGRRRRNSLNVAKKGTGQGTGKGAGITPSGPIQATRGSTAHEIKSIYTDELHLSPVDQGHLQVPSLSYGLERVLFNPGVYHLQDPRSRVFNFDPYLQTIMPVSEFDFNALKQYITSSRDNTLLAKAAEEDKKYTGSTSSMTSSLAHFHFLLSQWRGINTGTLSQNFPVEYNTFTALQRAPTAIFLRLRNGRYAIDADKQFDTANILSMLGKSMEKFLTLPTDDFERYRKQNSDQISEEERNEEEAFHYTTMGDFLMRSQLDAHDSRLPGTGMFDLKTRAVVSIRMDTSEYLEGSGYEIRSRHGEWESFEREYYDMIRAAFLKYSLQVRMGRMDGVFVAFHNTERIFGFQYISLPEMDYALHGTEDTTLGNKEFKVSLELLNRVLDRATARFPDKSLRLHFETRDTSTPFMYIFAEPIEEIQIEEIQASNKAEVEKFEAEILGLVKDEDSEAQRNADWDHLRANVEESMDRDEEADIDEEQPESEILDEETVYHQEQQVLATAAQDGENSEDEKHFPIEEVDEKDEECRQEEITIEHAQNENLEDSQVKASTESLLEEISDETATEEEATASALDSDNIVQSEIADSPKDVGLGENESQMPDKSDDEISTKDSFGSEAPAQPSDSNPEKEILAMTLVIRNKVNGEYVERPENLNADSKWTVEYALAEVSDQHRAEALYFSTKERRRKTLSKARDDAKRDAWNNSYLESIKRLSKKGRQWRQKINKEEKHDPVKVLGATIGDVAKSRDTDDLD